VIADVHGNYLALEAVVADLRTEASTKSSISATWERTLDARRTMDALMALDAVHVLGNHDRYLIDGRRSRWGHGPPAHAQLDADHLAWLRTVPPTLVFRDSVFLCHATPASDQVYWLETVLPTAPCGCRRLRRSKRPPVQSRNAHPLRPQHIARAVRLADGRLIVNPGSVGSPGYRDSHPFSHVIEAGTPDARYAILEFAAAAGGPPSGTCPMTTRRWRIGAPQRPAELPPRWRPGGSIICRRKTQTAGMLPAASSNWS